MEQKFNVDFNRFMEIVNNKESACHLERHELDEIHRLCAYHGLWDEDGYGFDDRQNSVFNLIASLQAMIKSTRIMEIVNKNYGIFQLEQKEVDEIHLLGADNGLWNEKNYGEHCRQNTVSLLISALQEMIKSTINKTKQEAETPQEKQKEQTKWHVRINGGPEQVFVTKTGIYHLAVSAALAMLDYTPSENGQELVEIWVPSLLPEYGPYFYIQDSFQVYPVSKPAGY